MAKQTAQPASFNHVTDAAPEYVDVILWHRVVLALSGLVIALAGIGFLLFNLMGEPVAEGDDEIALNPDSMAAPAAIPATTDTPAFGDQTEEDQTATAPAAETVAVKTVTIARHDAITADAATTVAAQEDAEAPVKTPPATTTLALANAVAPTAAATTESQAAAPAQPQMAGDFNVTTKILVPAVKRALITETMRGKEPGDAITDTRSLADKERFSLYQYVDIRGQAGETLIYHWKRNGKTVAKVRVPVGSDKWRNYSSKNFNQRLLGDWRVDVTNSKGMLLVRSEFHLE